MPKYDDVGSLPLPEGIEREEFDRGLVNMNEWALDIYKNSMKLKIGAGVQVPCYPQLRDMNDQFLQLLGDPDIAEEPYLISKDMAILPEIEALRKLDMKGLELKMCVTGPLELSLAEFGNRVSEDVMLNMARSLKRFIENAESLKDINVQVVSIDEPSLGTNPQIMVESKALKDSWNIVGKTKANVQIHLHSPLPIKIACKTKAIDIVDIGTAASPGVLDIIDPEILSSYDKRIRVGISRTDVLAMAAEFNEKYEVNVWTDEKGWREFLNGIERPSKIAKRIENAYEKFGNLIEYLGPDCGLGGARFLELAKIILKNTGLGIAKFQSKGRN